jgi:hypothetical protein
MSFLLNLLTGWEQRGKVRNEDNQGCLFVARPVNEGICYR